MFDVDRCWYSTRSRISTQRDRTSTTAHSSSNFATSGPKRAATSGNSGASLKRQTKNSRRAAHAVSLGLKKLLALFLGNLPRMANSARRAALVLRFGLFWRWRGRCWIEPTWNIAECERPIYFGCWTKRFKSEFRRERSRAAEGKPGPQVVTFPTVRAEKRGNDYLRFTTDCYPDAGNSSN